MFNENFWIFLSFVAFVGLSFSFVRRAVASSIEKKIKSVDDTISASEEANIKAHKMLISLKNDYEKAKMTMELTIDDAKKEADIILKEAEERIINLNLKSEELFEEYKKQSEIKMLETLKSEVLVSVLSLIETESLSNQTEQIKNIENSRKILKKLWN